MGNTHIHNVMIYLRVDSMTNELEFSQK